MLTHLSQLSVGGLSTLAVSTFAAQKLSRFIGTSSPTNQAFDVEVLPYKVHRIESPPTTVTTSKDELMGFYREMQLLRRTEVAADIQYKGKAIRGFCHLYDGQEAVIVGITASSDEMDSIITSYRDHCTHIAKGGTVKEVMGELMGKIVGASRGVGGSMHMYNKSKNFYGGAGIVGAQIPVGAGLALAHKMKKDGLVSYTLYGDGAANQGQKYEALNIAALWELPCIFVCENNHYGMGTAEWRAAKSADFYTRGDYIPGLKVDGMDVLAVKNAVKYARNHAINTGPIILEMDTYRYHGHSMSDPGSTYRTRDEVSTMRQERDPILRVKKLLLEQAGVEEKELKAIDKEIKNEVDKEVEECKAAPEPPLDFLYSNIYLETKNCKMRGVDSTSYHDAKIIPYPA